MNSTKRLVRISLLSAFLVIAQVSLSFIPNVELVTVLLMAYTLVFGLKESLIISIIFSTLQWMIYGVHTWVILYYLIWPLLVVLTSSFHKHKPSYSLFALFAAAFGFFFGIADALINGVFFGVAAIFTTWIRGLTFDIIHAFSNYLTVLLLLEPIENILRNLNKKLERN